MKAIKYLLIFFAFFLIFIGPALKIGGYLIDQTFITNKEYFLIVVLFLVAVEIFTDKNKEASK